jgi:hypothetical protein
VSRLVGGIACACLVVVCGVGVARQGSARPAGAAQCYAAALRHLAAGDYEQAYTSARQADNLRPHYQPYEQLLARLEPTARHSKLRAFARAARPDDEASVEQLAAYLKKGADDDESRAWLLYSWITDRVGYDIASFLAGTYTSRQYSPATVLKTRVAVCDGYSQLYTAVGKEMGLEVVTIGGHAKGFSYRTGVDDNRIRHAWNGVRLGGKWRLIDSTWGAGSIKDGKFHKQFDDFFFCCRPEALILTHYPLKAEDQFLDPPVPPERWKSWPKVEARALLRYGFEPVAIRELLEHKTPPVEAYVITCPLTVQAPLGRELDSRQAHTIRVESPAAADVALIHGGQWHFASRRGSSFSCVCRGMVGAIVVAVKPFGQKSYYSVLKYEGVRRR